MSKLKYEDMRIVSNTDYESVCNQNQDFWKLAKKITDSEDQDLDAIKLAVGEIAQRYFSSALDSGFYSQFPTFKFEANLDDK